MSSVNSATSPVDSLVPRMASLSIGSTNTVTPSTDPSPRVSPLTLPTTDPKDTVSKAYKSAVSGAKTYGTITPLPRHRSVMDLTDTQDLKSDKRNPHYVVSTVDADGKRTITVVPIDFSNPTTKKSSASVRSAESTIVQAAKCECGDTTSHDFTVQSREIYRRNYMKVTRYSDVVKGTKGTRLTHIKKK